MKKFSIVAVIVGALLLLGSVMFIAKMNARPAVIDVTDSTFQTVLSQAKTPVFIEFYVKDNCSYCQQEQPVLEEAAKQLKGHVLFLRVDANANPGLVKAAGVTSVPDNFLLDPTTGRAVRADGALDEKEMVDFLTKGLQAIEQPTTGNGGGDDNGGGAKQ